ncbi:NAD(P)/FAD-dependent oxidoreductase [Rhodococcus sp. 06-156-3C]|uniref:flavin-containing monooxygenase n=1 Tax=Nocardiaceae TaxID=85025 RepID=UPI0009B8385F|nr:MULTISPECIES: NAD(P)/FAD-dependent oxidoreductase [Rhodococcus]OZD18259.1 NAD(P)/FAD-dependent oxidoreductase [Rhodococcus sp. 06-156-4C]OZD18857.1 NAD(P)/FAD-dependent oxidoreductase [Rhodococcus sp. 06-156-3C]OZD22367.1 NAD(P)/FAD-dependent oxidoreductase [Rhodococcus sp. 06-156-4a]OZD33951.1 NAD(P)/FAD-dependent oxidoreductase [Rhodococcus sp. 06-156-3b]OZD38688.1 NAD(P)/FAD-dependent oxidoreductase [Rhodococcus sp. 06-156-3]
MNREPTIDGDDSAIDDSSTEVDVVIVGAGFAGVGMGVQLARQTSLSFVILEREGDVGGSWRDNIYPGVACDVPSHLYSYSFRTNPDWSRQYSPGAEIWDYIRSVADDEGLGPNLRFGAEMLDARWNETSQKWTVDTPKGAFTGRHLILATGHLTDPKLPPLPGIEGFAGEIVHSARWDPSIDWHNKRVGVVGSGASAIQIVPELAKVVEKLVVFQRTPAYVTPRRDRTFTDSEKRQFRRDPRAIDDLRQTIFWGGDYQFAARRMVPQYIEEAQRIALSHLADQVPAGRLRDQLTPDYHIGCKRILKSDDFYPALQRDNVTLEPSALSSFADGTPTSAAGTPYELDVLVFATGFETWDLPSSHRVFGRGGVSLGGQWSTGMQAFNSVAVHNFPNMYLLNGPATSLGHNSIIYMIETQIDYVLGALGWSNQHGDILVEVDAHDEQNYADRLHTKALRTTLLNGGCSSWYVDPRNGKSTLAWPDFAHTFRDHCALFDPEPYLRNQSDENIAGETNRNLRVVSLQ